jgi:hypothetical protein
MMMRIDPDTLLRAAVSGCDIDLIRRALEAGADIKSPAALVDAVTESSDVSIIEVIDFFLDPGADVNVVDPVWGKTPLLAATGGAE